MKTLVLLASFCVFQAQAFYLFGRREERVLRNETAVPDQCLRQAALGQCEFYQCLEDRFTCGRNGYTKSVSEHFCLKIDRAYNEFTASGQNWLNSTSICLMSYMLDIYSGEATTCSDIQDAGTNAILTCNARTLTYQDRDYNFCHFIQSNREEYKSLMGLTELGKLVRMDSRVWQAMVGDVMGCGVSSLMDRASSLLSRIGSIFN